MANHKAGNARTVAAIRQNVKPGTDQKRRIRCAWENLPCAWCLLPMSYRPTRTGRGYADATIGHVVPFATVLTYAPQYVAPQCGTCQKATRERDCTGEVAPAADWQAVTDRDAKAWAAAGNDPATHSDTWEAAEAITAGERDAARRSRLGW